MRLDTERLYLREMTEKDFDDLYEILGNKENMKYYSFDFDEKIVMNWIVKSIEMYRVFGFGLWAVVLKENGKMIGDCGITMQNINGRIKPEIGYHINLKYHNQGYAKEAAKKCRDWGFENTPFGALYSYMTKDNVASSATAKSCGMKHIEDYIDKDNVEISVYSITRKEWEELKGLK